MNHTYFVYVLTDKGRKTLYVGVTNDLPKRLWEHRNPEKKASFSQHYHCILLVYYEQFPDPQSAIAREKQIKGWRREKKNALIESTNPSWEELSAEWP